MLTLHYLNMGANDVRRKCNLFGITDASASAIGSVIGAGANIASSAITNKANKDIAEQTNQTNKEIHEVDNQFNAEQAEIAREFNAEQARIAREWSSEQEVMRRRAEAGLNVASDGKFSSTSASPASASPASASSPVAMQAPTMQAPDLAEGVKAALEVIKAPHDIKQTDAITNRTIKETQKLGAEIDNIYLSNEYQRIINEKQPQLLNWQLKNLIENTRLTKFRSVTEQAIADKTKEECLQLVMQGYYSMAENERQNTRLDLDIKRLDTDLYGLIEELKLEAQKYKQDWEKELYRMSYEFGDKTSDIMRGQEVKGSITSSKFFANVSSSFKGVFRVNGGYESTDTNSNEVMRTGEGQLHHTMRNTELFNLAVKTLTCVSVLEDTTSSRKARENALRKLYQIRTSVTDYMLLRQQMKLLDKPQDNTFRTSD